MSEIPGTTPASPGRAAYEAFQRAFPSEDWGPWEHLDRYAGADPEPARPGWEAIAQAAIESGLSAADDGTLTAAGRLADLLESRKRLYAERDEARAVVREMCAHWERIGTTREEDERIPGWRERAGLEASS